MRINLIGFDADDTLWHTETHYLQAQQALGQLLSPWSTPERVAEVLDTIELDNLPIYGYGIKAFVLSLIEAAIRISGGEIRGDQIEEILKIGRGMIEAEVVLRPHVLETLQKLAHAYRMIIITKGDLLDQTEKVARSGLGDYFSRVEVVNDKTVETYTQVLNKYDVAPHNFIMVGNSLRSDVHPVLKLGGTAVHIPADTIWEHEMVPDFNTSQNGYYLLDHFGQLTALIRKLSDVT